MFVNLNYTHFVLFLYLFKGDKGDKGDRGMTTTLKAGELIPTGIIEGPPGPPGPPGIFYSSFHLLTFDIMLK